MSHLKKLSDVLRKTKTPKAHEIIRLGNAIDQLEYQAFRHPSISKLMRNYQIPSLILSAKSQGLVSLSSNQVRIDSSVFVMHSNLEDGKWRGYSSTDSDYKVYINPMILEASDDLVSGLEECPSLPLLVAQVDRNSSIKVEYMNLEGEYIQEEFKDFPAQVFQHEVDHLNGILMTNFSVSFGRIHSTRPENTKNIMMVLEEFKDEIQENLAKYEESLKSSELLADQKISDKSRQYIEKAVFNPTFENDLKSALRDACSQDYFSYS